MSDQMISVRLPDGSDKQLPVASTGADLAASIGPGLARAAVAVTVDGELRDLDRPLTDGDAVSIVTRTDDSEEALY